MIRKRRGADKWEINIAATYEHSPGEQTWELPALDVNYGLGDHIQLKVETAVAVVDQDHHGPVGGLGNALAGVKWRFLDEENSGVSMSTYPQVEWNWGHAFVRRGLAEEGTHLLLPIEVAHKFGWLALDAEVGDTIDFDGTNEWFYGLLAAIEVNERLEVMAEVHGISEFDRRGDVLTINVGGRRQLSEHIALLLSIGRDVRALSNESMRSVAYLGLQFGF